MNLDGQPLRPCLGNKTTGYFRNNYCRSTAEDSAAHIVCATMTNDFLAFTKSRGNDLTTPRESFPGLKSGDKWCICAKRWAEAVGAGKSIEVDRKATDIHAKAYGIR